MQEVITYILIALASAIAIYKLYHSIFAKKKTASGCGDCGCGKKECNTNS